MNAAGGGPGRSAGDRALTPLQPAAGCSGETCVTCSDTAVPVTVVALAGGGLAVVDAGMGRREEVSVALVQAKEGDTVLVHAGEAIAVVAP